MFDFVFLLVGNWNSHLTEQTGFLISLLLDIIKVIYAAYRFTDDIGQEDRGSPL